MWEGWLSAKLIAHVRMHTRDREGVFFKSVVNGGATNKSSMATV